MNLSKDVDELDPVRARIVKLATHRGLTLKELSLKIGRNHAYLQQFVRRGSPRMLPETIRLELAKILGVPESDLNASKSQDYQQIGVGWRELSDTGLMSFAMRLAVVRLNSANPTPALFASSLGIAAGRYSDLENGVDDPTLHELNVISQTSMVSLDWLIRGPVGIDVDGAAESEPDVQLPDHGSS